MISVKAVFVYHSFAGSRHEYGIKTSFRDLKGPITMSTFGIGEKVALKSESTPMIITGFDDKFPKTANCLWFDESKNAQFEMLPEAILKSLEGDRSQHLIVRRHEETILVSDVVRTPISDIQMTVAGVTEGQPARVTCYWLNADKQIKKVIIPAMCLKVVEGP